MSARKALLVLLGAIPILLPTALAQNLGDPVDGCATECTPQDANPGTLPKAGAESVKAILYGHFLQLNQDGILNQQSIDKCEPNLELRRSSPILSTYTGVKEADIHLEHNWHDMISSAGLLEFGSDCKVREHQEPGLAVPLKVKGETVTLYWYVSAVPVPGQSSTDTPSSTFRTTVLPFIGVYAHVETGRERFMGEMLAQGDSAPDDELAPTSPTRVTIINVPGEDEVYEFAVPLRVLKSEWPDFFSTGGGAGFTVAVNTYETKQKGEPLKGSQAMQADWRIRTGPKWMPRLVVETENPLTTKSGSLTIFNRAMFVRWSIVSPYGSYDVDDLSVQAYLQGPKDVDRTKAGLAEPLFIKRSLDHDGHFLPVNVTWKFDYRKGELPDGDYSLRLVAKNFRGTYEVTHTLPFKMEKGEPIDVPVIGQLLAGGGEATLARVPPKEASGAGLVVAAVALLGGLLALRRRD